MASRETARCGILPDDRLTPGLEPIFRRHFALFVSRVQPRKAPAPGSSSAQASQHMISLPAPASGWACVCDPVCTPAGVDHKTLSPWLRYPYPSGGPIQVFPVFVAIGLKTAPLFSVRLRGLQYYD